MIVDVAVLALTLYEEAAGETREGKEAVLDVITNRRTKTGKSWRRVCLAPKQFSCWNVDPQYEDSVREVLQQDIPDCPAWRDCLDLADQAVNQGRAAQYPFTHYYSPALCSPAWGASMQQVMIIGHHRFGVTK